MHQEQRNMHDLHVLVEPSYPSPYHSHEDWPHANDFSHVTWRDIHDRAAQDYRRGEWLRESVFGVAWMRRQLFERATGQVLDVACGYGMNFGYLPNAMHTTGIDFSPVMLEMAQTHADQFGHDVTLAVGDAEALDFPDDSFDTVISALSTCSFQNPIKALQEMRRVCKPGGRILLVEHGRSTWEWIGRYQDRHVDAMIAQGGCYWNQDPLELVAAAGLRMVATRRAGLGIFHMIQATPNKSI
jgi:ubiquinone/menaquinone biosynthesis C-methylase UbiE